MAGGRVRVFGLTVTRNEEGRYLRSMLRSVEGLLDGHLVYDDCSEDGTRKLCQEAGCEVVERTEPWSFAQSEGRFRQQSLEALECTFKPTGDDFCLVIDADEVLVIKGEPLACKARHAVSLGYDALQLKIREIWDASDPASPKERKDHHWGVTTGVRLWRWREGARYVLRDKDGNRTFCGHVPDRLDRKVGWAQGIELHHYAYADPADRQERYDRYIKDRTHSFIHVRSIIEKADLRPVRVEQEVRRGE